MSKQIKSNKRRISRLSKSLEIKHVYFVQTLTASTATNVFSLLNGIETGNSNETRIGNKITMKNVEINVKILNTAQDTAAAIGITSSTRIILFIDNLNDGRGTEFSIFDILKDTASSDARVTSVYNRDFVGKGEKVQILYDRYFSFAVGSKMEHVIKIRRRLGHKVVYSDVSSTKASILTKTLQLLVIQGDIVSSTTISAVLNFTE